MPKVASPQSKMSQIIKNIEKFDDEHLDSMLEHYSAKQKLNEKQPDNSTYRKELLKKIIEGYYTFQQSATNKPLAFIKSPIYHQLFKYLHRQIHFNSYLKSYLQLADDELHNLKVENSQLREQISNIQAEIRQLSHSFEDHIQKSDVSIIENLSDFVTEQAAHFNREIQTLDHRQNANYELIKRSNFGRTQHHSPGSKVFYSQFGEDAWIIDNLDIPKHGFFVDVGAADGITFSNTYYFEKQGWEGICFEPNPENFTIASQIRQKVEPIAITLHDGTAEFYIDPHSPDWSGLERSTPTHTDSIQVKTKTLSHALRDANFKQVDLLSVDTEGTELDVLNSLDFSLIKPTIMIIEFLSRSNADKRKTILKQIDSMTNRGYTLAHTTKANLILVSK